jgi:methionyl-tRNA formyltransferase
MRLCVLTTDTLHHAYFVRTLAERGHEILVLSETRRATGGYEATADFESQRDQYERDAWFGGRSAGLAQFAQTLTVPDVNDAESIGLIVSFRADLVVSFGTGILRSGIISALSARLLNLHGGDPESYRGLDTHLWAIWHRDFGALTTCIHRVDAILDNGDIVAALPVPIEPLMPLAALRSANTGICVELVDLAVRQVAQRGSVYARPQRKKGRYYGAMPSALKAQCQVRFTRYTSGLA